MDRWLGILFGTVCALALTASPVRVAGAGEPLEEPDQPIAAVQALLRQERLYSGSVDGVLSEETVAGIRRYQILHRLRATGRLDAATLRLMLLPPSPSPGLTDSDREMLRELARTPLPEPTAELRKPIPPGEPAAAAPDNQRHSADRAGKNGGRSKSAKHRHGSDSSGARPD